MKRSIGMLFAITFALAPPAMAQGLGLKGGFSYGDVSNRGLLPGELTSRSGFAIGLGLGTTSTPFSVGIEGLYAQRGVVSDNGPDARRLDYIDVPAYLRVAIPTSVIAPYAFAGPQLSFEVRCRDGGGADCPDTDRPMVTYAAVIGGGIRLGSPGALSLEGRYIYGLNDLKLSTVTSSESYQTRSFMILLGLGF